MKKIVFLFIIGVLTLNLVSSTLTEEKIEHAIPIISKICPFWDNETIINIMYDNDCSFGMTFVEAINCGPEQIISYRCDGGTHSIKGIDLTTLPNVEFKDNNINIGGQNVSQSIDKSQKEIKNEFSWYSLISNIIISFFCSAVFYLLLYENGDSKRKKKAWVISIICFVVLMILLL